MTSVDQYLHDVTSRMKELYDKVAVGKTYRLGIAQPWCPIYHKEYEVFEKTCHNVWPYSLGCRSPDGVIWRWIVPGRSLSGTRQCIVSIEEVRCGIL